jgi:hypothetical protein
VKPSIAVLSSVALLLLAVAGASTAAEPEMWLWGPGGNAADIGREVLWLDNPDFGGNTGSSEVIGAYDLWSEIAGNLLLDVDATIRKVTWWGSYWNGFEEPTGSGFNLRFYNDAGDCVPEDAPILEHLLPGNDCCETLADGGDQFSQFVYAYCLDLPLAAGTYWFSAQMADHEFPPQWGRLGAEWNHDSCVSMFRSPYFSYPDWEPANEVFEPWFASQMFEDECEPTAVENASWGAVKRIFR